MSNSPRAAKFHRSNRPRKAARVTAVTVLLLCLLALAPAPPPAGAQTLNGADIVISQIYTRGGEPGAVYQNDYVELFNRGSQPVNIGNWALHIAQPGPIPTSIYVRFPTTSRVINPGRYLLIKLAGGANGAPLPLVDADQRLDFEAGERDEIHGQAAAGARRSASGQRARAAISPCGGRASPRRHQPA